MKPEGGFATRQGGNWRPYWPNQPIYCMVIPINDVPTGATPTQTSTTETPTTIEPTTVPLTTEPAASPMPLSPTESPTLFFRGRLIQSENTHQQNTVPIDQLGFNAYAQGNSMWNSYGYAYPQWGPRAYAQDRGNPWPYAPFGGPRGAPQSYSQSSRWNTYSQSRDYAPQNDRARIQNMYGFNK